MNTGSVLQSTAQPGRRHRPQRAFTPLHYTILYYTVLQQYAVYMYLYLHILAYLLLATCYLHMHCNPLHSPHTLTCTSTSTTSIIVQSMNDLLHNTTFWGTHAMDFLLMNGQRIYQPNLTNWRISICQVHDLLRDTFWRTHAMDFLRA